MEFIDRIEGLEALYGPASVGSQRKVAQHLTPSYRRWIEASRFCILSTVGESGTDGSPRGDDGPVVRVLDPVTLAMPDWRGNRSKTAGNMARYAFVALCLLFAQTWQRWRTIWARCGTGCAPLMFNLSPR